LLLARSFQSTFLLTSVQVVADIRANTRASYHQRAAP
jgi:hypothetical protein